MGIALDPQAAGWHDDGTDGGAIRAKLVRGDLVPVPFRKGEYVSDSVSATCTFQDADLIDNADGSHSGIFVSVAADPTRTGKGARIRFPFYGRALGIRYRRDSTACAFTVAIDGVNYAAGGPNTYLDAEGVSVSDGHGYVLIADDLSEGVHYADVSVAADASVTNSVVLLGYLVEARAGYQPRPHYLNAATDAPGVVPNAATAISKGGSGNQLELCAVRKIFYANVTAGAITVTIKRSGNVVWKKNIAANDTVEFDPGGLLALTGTMTHEASAAGSVTYTVIGGH